MTVQTYEMPWWIAVDTFYDEENAGELGHTEAKREAFENAKELGPGVAAQQLGKVLVEFKQYHKGFEELQVGEDAQFEECDSGNLGHAMAYYKVDMKGSSEAFAKFIAWYLGEEEPETYLKPQAD